MAMFIVGEATFITGFADKVGALAVRLSKGNTVLLLVYTMPPWACSPQCCPTPAPPWWPCP